MIPAKFDYAAPATLDDAIRLLADRGDDARPLAGGHSLLPLMKVRLAEPALLVDLRKIPDLRGIRDGDGAIWIGAMTTHAEIAASDLLAARVPLLPEVARQIGDPQVRNRGTIGGSLAHADPGGDYPAAVRALSVTVVARGPDGERDIAINDLFEDLMTTSLAPAEIITGVRVPVPAPGTGTAYEKYPNPASHYAVVGVAAALRVQNGTIAHASVGVTGASAVSYRATGVEDRLRGAAATEATLREAAGLAADGVDLLEDLVASTQYRAHLTRVHTQRALTRALAAASTS